MYFVVKRLFFFQTLAKKNIDVYVFKILSFRTETRKSTLDNYDKINVSILHLRLYLNYRSVVQTSL